MCSSDLVKMDGPAIHSSMLTPLLLMAVGYTALFVWIMIIRIRAEMNATKLRAQRIRQAEA